jgi:DNA gyrase subunit A
VLATRDFSESKYLAFATREGMIKKTAFLDYNTPIKADGIIAIRIKDGDSLVAVRPVDDGDTIIMVSRSGNASRFEESKARAMGRATAGVRGMNVSAKGNAVLSMDVAQPGQDLLVVTDNGFGKRTPIDDYPIKGRGTMGVRTIALTEKKGALVGALVVREHHELVFISQGGMVQRNAVRDMKTYGRSSQGVNVMNLKEDDCVSAVALVVEPEGASVSDDAANTGDGAKPADGGQVADAAADAEASTNAPPTNGSAPASD